MPQQLQSGASAPWKQRYRAPIVARMSLAAARPVRGLITTNRTGRHQLYAWDVESGALRQLTDRAEGQVDGVIWDDGEAISYLHDEKGNEIGHWLRLPFPGGPPVDLTPDLPAYASGRLVVPASGRIAVFTRAVDPGFELCALAIDAGAARSEALRTLHRTEALCGLAGVSASGDVAYLSTTERTGTPQTSLLALAMDDGRQIGELWDGGDSGIDDVVPSRVPGDIRVLASSNRSGSARPLIWDPTSGERRDLATDGPPGELSPLDWSSDGRLVLLGRIERAEQQIWLLELQTGGTRQLDRVPRGAFGGWGFVTQFGPDGEIVTIWQDSTHAPSVVALDPSTGELRRTLVPAGDVPAGHRCRSVTFPSSDGELIQGWLGIPDGEPPFPTILDTHGGPESVQLERFSPAGQAWLDHGFAFLSINYRGSTTFGREFQQKLYRRPGYWEVEDMVAGRAWLVEQGIAHPDEVFCTGWSWGGYLTLQALGTRPGLWAGGMAGVAVADFVSQFEDENEFLRAYDVALFGGAPDERPEQYAESSPITHAERVDAPVLIIQGRNDTRCPDRQVELYEARMRELGKPIEVVWFDAGHIGGFADVELGISHQERMLEFALDVLARRPVRSGR